MVLTMLLDETEDALDGVSAVAHGKLVVLEAAATLEVVRVVGVVVDEYVELMEVLSDPLCAVPSGA